MPAPVLRSHNATSLKDRVQILRSLVWGRQTPQGSLRDPLMRRIALAVTRNCPARDDTCELQAIYDFVVMNVRYTGDVVFKDTFQSALRTMQFGGGDCDDHSILAATLAMANGFQFRWRITSNTGASWDHIYGMAGVPKHNPKTWIALDTTLGKGKFGRQPPMAKKEDFEVKEG